MKKGLHKKTAVGLVIIITTMLIAYGGYTLYNYAIENAIQRIKAGVTTGIRKSVVSAINPVTWVGKIFGHKKDKDKSAEEKTI